MRLRLDTPPSHAEEGVNGPARLGGAAEAMRRVMLRTSAGPLHSVWRLAYRLSARAVSAYLRKGQPDCGVYALGDPAGPDTVYGVSDIDLVVVTPGLAGRPGDARQAILARWGRLCRRLPALRNLFSIAVYEVSELERGMAGTPSLSVDPSAGPARSRALLQPSQFAKPPDVALRAGLGLPPESWRRLAGPDRFPPALASEAHEPMIAAWLELQHWWRHAFSACLPSRSLYMPYLCVKLAAEPARIWIWLTDGERISSRREVLKRAIVALPDERETFERALCLLRDLHRSPEPPVSETVAAFLRLSVRIARRLASELGDAGVTEVGLVWGGEEELALPAGARDALQTVTGTEVRLLPLTDWRALAYPGGAPDETFALVPGSAADPPTVAALALVGDAGPYPALPADGLLVLPALSAGRTKLRAVHCPLSDPVSFALVAGSVVAAFPNAGGWSIEAVAARAVAENRALLASNAGRPPSHESIPGLLSCARAALLLESVEAGAPELPLTLRATAASLGARYPAVRGVAEESCGTFSAWREGGVVPPAALAPSLRQGIVELPVFVRGGEGA